MVLKTGNLEDTILGRIYDRLCPLPLYNWKKLCPAGKRVVFARISPSFSRVLLWPVQPASHKVVQMGFSDKF